MQSRQLVWGLMLVSQYGTYYRLSARESAQTDKQAGNTAPAHEAHLGMDQDPSTKGQSLIRRRKR